ncbi:hypothetical protein ACFC0C_08600 [Streptomyces sp. NPDC056178]|uniref:hypothetical protein n=1 Tax=Streptomyces sp. NPDC056178 TaxID=3345735 RepID=UPI0035DD627A
MATPEPQEFAAPPKEPAEQGHDLSRHPEPDRSSGGREGTPRIDDGGKPFRTSGIKARRRYTHQHDTAQSVTE